MFVSIAQWQSTSLEWSHQTIRGVTASPNLNKLRIKRPKDVFQDFYANPRSLTHTTRSLALAFIRQSQVTPLSLFFSLIRIPYLCNPNNVGNKGEKEVLIGGGARQTTDGTSRTGCECDIASVVSQLIIRLIVDLMDITSNFLPNSTVRLAKNTISRVS